MSSNNGIIRIGRKGTKKFAFGEDGPVFEVDVVEAFQEWVSIDDQFRRGSDGEEALPDSKVQEIRLEDMPSYHSAAVQFVRSVGVPDNINPAEALDFIARLREQYDELADFFCAKEAKKARLARYFGDGIIGVLGGVGRELTAFDELVIGMMMSRTQAWEQLNDYEYSGKLGMNDFYELVLNAGYSEEQAQMAATQRGNSRLDNGVNA